MTIDAKQAARLPTLVGGAFPLSTYKQFPIIRVLSSVAPVAFGDGSDRGENGGDRTP